MKLELGADANRNGTLDTSEVNALLTQYVCNGTTGAADSGWALTDSMVQSRDSHEAILLPDGKVLATGGHDGVNVLSTAEVYNPVSNTWNATNPMSGPRSSHEATLLPNGKVLISGGVSTGNFGSALQTTEIYDPVTGIWSAGGSMLSHRGAHTATLLPNGKILIVGGQYSGTVYTSAELFDPAAGTSSATGSMASPRLYHKAILLPNGKVLVVGGNNGSNVWLGAELYDPNTGTWSTGGDMLEPRVVNTVTLLPNGKVLVAGGHKGSSILATAEVYDPVSNTWSATGSMSVPRYSHTATRLPTGKVLVAGGRKNNNSDGVLPTAESYDTNSGTWSSAASMSVYRDGHTAILLSNGKVLVLGGSGRATAELYAP